MRSATLCVPALAVVLLAGCTDDDGGHEAHHAAHGTTNAPAATPTPSDSVPVLQPGRPGETNRTRSAGAPAPTERTHPADLTFMQHMRVHHGQALTMVKIVDGRLTDATVRAMAGRIQAEQKPEMGYMTRWVAKHSTSASSSTGGHGGHADHAGAASSTPADHSSMPGMATPAQLKALRKTSGKDTDRLFLHLMIRHHQGAITMVGDRVTSGGTDPDVERFGGDIQSGQGSQIRHMRKMLDRLGGPIASGS